MTIWEFRRLVRARRVAIQQGCCPLGAAMQWDHLRNPMPTTAARALELPNGYVFGVVGGFDNTTPRSMLPDSEVFNRGERFGARMRIVRALRGWA